MKNGNNRWIASWSDYGHSYEEGFAEATALLEYILDLHNRLSAIKPIVELYSPTGNGRSIGLALSCKETVMIFQESAEGPYYLSVGDSRREGMSELFCHSQQGVDYYAYHLVDWETAIAVLKEFLETGGKSNLVRWEDL